MKVLLRLLSASKVIIAELLSRNEAYKFYSRYLLYGCSFPYIVLPISSYVLVFKKSFCLNIMKGMNQMHNENQSSEKFSPSEYKGEVSSEHGVASSYEYSGGVGVPNDYKGEAGAEMRADSLEVQEGSSEQFTSEQSNGVVPNIMPVPSHMRKTQESKRAHRRGLATVFLVFIIAALLFAPSPFVIEVPGPTANVYGRVSKDLKTRMISISGVRTYKDKGQLRLVTVSATGVPGYTVPTAAAIFAWFHPHMAVMPQEAVYSVDTTAEDYVKEGTQEMTGAQDVASKIGLQYAHKYLGVDVSKAKVKLNIDNVGGPSAGMIYTLGIITSLTATDEAGGKNIAGTGTIEKDGTIGAIGGIQLKMVGAQRDGASYFIAPESNCDEVVGHIPDGLKVYAVSTIDQAYKAVVAIGAGDMVGLKTCAVK